MAGVIGGRSTRRGVAGTLLIGLAIGGAVDARAETGLADLRLFVSPERRAALDGAALPAPSPGARTPARDEGRTDGRGRADTAAVPRAAPRPAAGSTDRSGPPPGTATVRSSRGTSRIVDGVPLPDGPS